MERFTAQMAQAGLIPAINEEYRIITDEIKKACVMCNTLDVDRYVKPQVLEMLQQDGYDVKTWPSLAQQKEGIYYTIMW